MPGETPALIRETFPVGPLQCNCAYGIGAISLMFK